MYDFNDKYDLVKDYLDALSKLISCCNDLLDRMNDLLPCRTYDQFNHIFGEYLYCKRVLDSCEDYVFFVGSSMLEFDDKSKR